MANAESRREHYNLYYIFQADQQQHTLPEERAEKILKNLLEIFSQIIKPNADVNPPC